MYVCIDRYVSMYVCMYVYACTYGTLYNGMKYKVCMHVCVIGYAGYKTQTSLAHLQLHTATSIHRLSLPPSLSLSLSGHRHVSPRFPYLFVSVFFILLLFRSSAIYFFFLLCPVCAICLDLLNFSVSFFLSVVPSVLSSSLFISFSFSAQLASSRDMLPLILAHPQAELQTVLKNHVT